MWSPLLKVRYGDTSNWRSSWCDKTLEGAEVSRWWGDLGCLEGVGIYREGWLSEGITRKLGRGNRISFWRENWTGLAPLATTFQRLFNISTTKEAKSMRWVNGGMAYGVGAFSGDEDSSHGGKSFWKI